MRTDRRVPGIAYLVAVTFFMETLDGTILVTAAPQIAADLGVASADVNVTMSAYLIAVACAIPLGGWLAARLGSRAVYCTSIAVFTLASLLCALSGDLTALTVGRIIQGIAGGMMVPVGRLVVLRGTERRDLVRAIAIITWPALVAPVLAPVVGGFITTIATWQWIFLINLPIGVTVFIVALVTVRDRTTERRALDWPGLVLVTVAVLGLMVAMELAAGSVPLVTVAAAGVALLAGTAAVWWLLRSRHPLLDLRVFRLPTFRVTNSGGFVYRAVVNAVPFVLPLLLQDAFGWTPLESGIAVASLFFGNLAIKSVTTPLLRRLGFRPVLLIGVIGTIGCLLLFALLSPGSPAALVATLGFASGVFRSIGFTAYNTIQFADVDRDELGAANTLSATLAQLAAGLGIAAAATILRLADVAADPYRVTFVVLAMLCVTALIGALRLPRDAARHISAG
ncbi:MFS transporter [Diaminobutyricimonas sp. LJ205]|uniref:MFS transporter n=1 Tax=Diaminobutyricimonas sp. LJ205 TaxID=2683590 RepID=UPI001E5970E8|nr:MFS transporter [Diaminobutyricimonas sp. LJ205]